MKNPTRQLDTLTEKIEAGDRGGTKRDRERLLEFARELKLHGNDYTDFRRLKLLRHCTRIAEEVGGLDAALTEKAAAEDIALWINDTYDNEETNRDYRVALRVIGRFLGENEHDPDDPPESIKWISATTSSTYDPSPEPANMLLWDKDVLPLIENTHNSRDAAMIALAFDLGPRGGEFEALTVGDISDGEYGLRVTVRGKQGKRTATVVPAVPHLNRWLADHPGGETKNAPLWSKLSKPEAMSYQMLTKVFREAGRRVAGLPSEPEEEDRITWKAAEIEAAFGKPLNLTNFRKSSAAHLASKGVNQAHIEDHHGWTRGSKVASRYVSVFAEEADREIAKTYGKDVGEKETDDISPVECLRCEKETPRDKKLCVWCGQALQPGAATEVRELERKMMDAMADADDAGARKTIRQALDRVGDDPEGVASALANYIGEGDAAEAEEEAPS